jgi:pimeloyl-ACP methyl ester carboxylesterase
MQSVQPSPPDDEQSPRVIQTVVGSYRHQPRAPLLGRPSDADLEYETVTFPSEDGVPLEAWLIPRKDSNKLIISNHPRYFNRYGFPSHLEPWKSLFAAGGNDFEINFIPDYRILHDAGYNVLTYDLRNHGLSADANGNLCTSGIFESRDVIGSLIYARSRSDTRSMTIGLFSRCLGCNSTFQAMMRRPDVFNGVRCLVGVQPVSPGVILERTLELARVPRSHYAGLGPEFKLVTSFTLEEASPVFASKSDVVPTYIYQVRDDVMTRPSDVQSIFDNIPIEDKELFWIQGSTKRWDGYAYFARNSDQVLAWLNEHMT